MAIRNVVTRGYGAGASIPFVVTRGYTIGEAAIVTGDGKLGMLSAGLYSPTGKIITLGKLGKP